MTLTAYEKVTPHDLFSRKIRPIYNWHGWLLRWQAAETVEEMVGLLHVGFDVRIGEGGWTEPKYELGERVAFYLALADGWADSDVLARSDDSGEHTYGKDRNGQREKKSTKELRQVVAKKAFDMLATNFFNAPEVVNGYRNWVWDEPFLSPLFSVIQDFFRVHEGRFGDRKEVRNLSWRDEVSHNEERAVGFLLTLIKKVWAWRETSIESWWKEDKRKEVEAENLEVSSHLEKAKTWTLEVLVYLRRLSVLREIENFLDPKSVEILREIALREQIEDVETRKRRRVKTLEEAVYAGSWVASFLLELEVRQREGNRLQKIREAVRSREQAERAIKENSK